MAAPPRPPGLSRIKTGARTWSDVAGWGRIPRSIHEFPVTCSLATIKDVPQNAYPFCHRPGRLLLTPNQGATGAGRQRRVARIVDQPSHREPTSPRGLPEGASTTGPAKHVSRDIYGALRGRRSLFLPCHGLSSRPRTAFQQASGANGCLPHDSLSQSWRHVWALVCLWAHWCDPPATPLGQAGPCLEPRSRNQTRTRPTQLANSSLSLAFSFVPR